MRIKLSLIVFLFTLVLGLFVGQKEDSQPLLYESYSHPTDESVDLVFEVERALASHNLCNSSVYGVKAVRVDITPAVRSELIRHFSSPKNVGICKHLSALSKEILGRGNWEAYEVLAEFVNTIELARRADVERSGGNQTGRNARKSETDSVPKVDPSSRPVIFLREPLRPHLF